MTYESAKQLKDAGFPQSGRGSWVSPPDILVARREDRVYQPTLSELIIACGEDFVALERTSNDTGTYWQARRKDSPVAETEASGRTPEEAVARLWLVLNQRDAEAENRL
jgi:hypothetical protein